MQLPNLGGTFITEAAHKQLSAGYRVFIWIKRATGFDYWARKYFVEATKSKFNPALFC